MVTNVWSRNCWESRQQHARGEGGKGMGIGTWCLQTSQTAGASRMRSTIAGRPHVVSGIGRTGAVQWAGVYARPGIVVKTGLCWAYVGEGRDDADLWALPMITRSDRIGSVASRPTEGP